MASYGVERSVGNTEFRCLSCEEYWGKRAGNSMASTTRQIPTEQKTGQPVEVLEFCRLIARVLRRGNETPALVIDDTFIERREEDGDE